MAEPVLVNGMFLQECSYRNVPRLGVFGPKVDPGWINCSSDLFSLLCVYGGNEVSSCDATLGLFNQALSDMGILGIADVHFDVSGGGLVRACSRLLMSVITGDGERFPVKTTTCSLTGSSECCGWLQFMTRGAGPVDPPIGTRVRTVIPGNRGDLYLDCVHSAEIS